MESQKDDLALLVITFIAALSQGAVGGICSRIGLGRFLFVVKTTRPHYAVLGKLPGRTDYRNVERHQTESTGGALVIRLYARFYYGNVSF